MAKKAETVNMVDQFQEFKELKNIDKATMISVLEESFRKTLANMFGTDENFDVIMNPDKGDCEIYQNLEVVPDGEVENKVLQIGLTEAREIDPECEIGEDVTKQIFFEKFGRRAILTLRQTLQGKILELQKFAIYSKFKELEGEILSGEVHQIWKREMLLIDEDQNELILPKEEQIKGDFFHKGDVVKVVVKRVDNPQGNPKVIVSRTDERFLRRLFEQEVPEIHDGLITIRAVARIPGERAKVAVQMEKRKYMVDDTVLFQQSLPCQRAKKKIHPHGQDKDQYNEIVSFYFQVCKYHRQRIGEQEADDCAYQ